MLTEGAQNPYTQLSALLHLVFTFSAQYSYGLSGLGAEGLLKSVSYLLVNLYMSNSGKKKQRGELQWRAMVCMCSPCNCTVD